MVLQYCTHQNANYRDKPNLFWNQSLHFICLHFSHCLWETHFLPQLFTKPDDTFPRAFWFIAAIPLGSLVVFKVVVFSVFLPFSLKKKKHWHRLNVWAFPKLLMRTFYMHSKLSRKLRFVLMYWHYYLDTASHCDGCHNVCLTCL